MALTISLSFLVLVTSCFTNSVLSCPEECSCSADFADCSGRNLMSIPFDIPTTVRVIRLNGNSITNVPNDAFLGMNNLQILSLANNKIDDIPPGTFLHTPQLMSLDISQNEIRYLARDTFKGLSDLRTLSIAYNSLQIISGLFRHTPNLGSLNLGDNNLKQLTDEDLKLTSSIKLLDLRNNEIRQVHPNAFRNISALRYLSIQNNPLGAELPDLNLTKTRLQVVDFTNCSLTRVPQGLPPTVNDLRLSRNKIVIVNETDIRNITRLQLLTLNHNQITNVLYRTFRGMEHLKELWLSHNKMVYIPRGLPSSLSKLYMDNNLISEMEESLFKNDSQLEYLSMEMNRIEMIPAGAFSNMQNLKVLDLKANRLEELKAGTFIDLPNLNYLDLSNNPIKAIAAGTFQDLQNLTKLGIAHSMSTMTDMGDNFLDAMPNVEILDIMNSPGVAKGIMKVLKMRSFFPLWKASTVNLMYCDLSTLPPEIKELLPNLEQLLLDDNPWICDTRLKWFKHWMRTTDLTFSKNKPVTCEQPPELKGVNIWKVEDREFIEPAKEEEALNTLPVQDEETSGTNDVDATAEIPVTPTTTEETTTTDTTTTPTTTTTTTSTTPSPTTTELIITSRSYKAKGRRPYNPFYNQQNNNRRRTKVAPTVASGEQNGVTRARPNRPIRRKSRKYRRRNKNRRRLRLRKRKHRNNGPTLRNLHIRHPKKKAEQIAKWRKQAEESRS